MAQTEAQKSIMYSHASPDALPFRSSVLERDTYSNTQTKRVAPELDKTTKAIQRA